MDIIVTFKDYETAGKEEYFLSDIDNPHSFSYVDNEDVICKVSLAAENVNIFRQTADHSTFIHLGANAYAEIAVNEGTIKIPIKMLAFSKDNDILSSLYSIEGYKKEFTIKFIRSDR